MSIEQHSVAQAVHLRQHHCIYTNPGARARAEVTSWQVCLDPHGQAKQKAELQNLRMRINRLRRMGEDTEDLLLELEDKEKSYGRGKQQRPPGAYLATNQIFSTE